MAKSSVILWATPFLRFMHVAQALDGPRDANYFAAGVWRRKVQRLMDGGTIMTQSLGGCLE
jgi:hypothetical protein